MFAVRIFCTRKPDMFVFDQPALEGMTCEILWSAKQPLFQIPMNTCWHLAGLCLYFVKPGDLYVKHVLRLCQWISAAWTLDTLWQTNMQVGSWAMVMPMKATIVQIVHVQDWVSPKLPCDTDRDVENLPFVRNGHFCCYLYPQVSIHLRNYKFSEHISGRF